MDFASQSLAFNSEFQLFYPPLQHPRTPNQTKAVLKGLKHVWKVEWSCGLGEGEEVTEPGQEQEEEEQDGSGFNPSRRASKASEGLSSSLSEGEEAHKSSSKKKELKSEPAPLRLTHPASKAFVNGTLSVSTLVNSDFKTHLNLTNCLRPFTARRFRRASDSTLQESLRRPLPSSLERSGKALQRSSRVRHRLSLGCSVQPY